MLRMFTTRDVANWDRVLRALPAGFIAWAWWAELLSGWPLWVGGVIAIMLLVTTILGSCSIYYMLGWSTCPLQEER